MPSAVEKRVRDYLSYRNIEAQFDVQHRHGHEILQVYSTSAAKRLFLGWDQQPEATVSYKGGNRYDKDWVYEATSKISGISPSELRSVAEGKLVAKANGAKMPESSN